MYFTSSTDFRNIELGGSKRFKVDQAGTVIGYTNTVNGRVRGTGQKIGNLDTLKPNSGQSGILGRHLLETKKFDKAIAFLTRGADYRTFRIVVGKRSYTFLFIQGRFQESD